MTVTLDLPPNVEQAFLSEARARGVSFDELVRDVLLERQPSSPAAELYPDEWVREFKAWTRSHAKDDLPLLSDEAMSRDFIYGEWPVAGIPPLA
jgi:hypothetical protein